MLLTLRLNETHKRPVRHVCTSLTCFFLQMCACTKQDTDVACDVSHFRIQVAGQYLWQLKQLRARIEQSSGTSCVSVPQTTANIEYNNGTKTIPVEWLAFLRFVYTARWFARKWSMEPRSGAKEVFVSYQNRTETFRCNTSPRLTITSLSR
jgi:hypothetical protein